MVVNDLLLPESFVCFLRPIREGRLPPDWAAKRGMDAYGHPWGASITIYTDEQSMQDATNDWTQSIPSEEDIREGTEWNGQEPGFVPYVADFSKVVCFGRTPSGEDVCFDYRDDPREPSVIYWDDTHWRRLAPGFDAFAALLQPYEAEPYMPSDEEWGAAFPSRAQVDDAFSSPNLRASEEERRELERQLRALAESPELEDEQWRRIEGLIIRLQSRTEE